MNNSLRLLFAFDKRWPHFVQAKVLTFFCYREKAFFTGDFGENRCFERGFFAVKLW
jgi:hypothetical protein